MSLLARLSKAKSQLFGTATKNVAVPFEVPCDCGHRVTGIRRTSYQIAECSDCQASIYVLPVNVYPTNRRIRSDVVDGPALDRVSTVVRELVKGDSVIDPSANKEPLRSRATAADDGATELKDYGTSEKPKKVSKGRKSRGSNPADPYPADTEVKVTAEPDVPVVQVPRISMAVRLRRLFSPTRVLAVAGVAILVSTGWWNVHQRQMQQARKVWRAEMDRAEDALKKRDLTTLGEALSTAVKAAITLNRSDADFQVADSLLRQTQAVQRLSSLDLVGQFSEMFADNGTFNESKATSSSIGLAGQCMVFEAVVRPSAANSEMLNLDFPLIVDGIPVDIRVASPLLRQCASKKPQTPLLFAAVIADCRPPSQNQRSWLITLEPDSCALITTDFHAEQFGFDVTQTPELKKIIEQQAAVIRGTGQSGITDQETPTSTAEPIDRPPESGEGRKP